MPKLPEFNTKPIKGLNQEDWGKLTVGRLNLMDANYAKTDYLVFKPELVHELAKPFTNAQQMIDYKGENSKLIKAAGRLMHHQKVQRPEWFEEIAKGNAETLEECLTIARQYSSYSKFFKEKNRIYNRIGFLVGYNEMKDILRGWMKGVTIDYTDDFIYSILKKYKTTVEVKKTEWKKLLHKVQLDKGKEFPKSFKLYEKMKQSAGNKKGLKRDNYDQRTPAIEQYDLNNNYIQTFETWNDVITAGFNRSSVTNAIKGQDGHHRHKKFIWKYK